MLGLRVLHLCSAPFSHQPVSALLVTGRDGGVHGEPKTGSRLHKRLETQSENFGAAKATLIFAVRPASCRRADLCRPTKTHFCLLMPDSAVVPFPVQLLSQ